MQLAIHDVVGFADLFGQHQVAGRAAEKNRRPHVLGKLLSVERAGLGPRTDDHIDHHALFQHGDRHQRTLAGKIFGTRVVRRQLHLVDDARLAGVQKLAEQPAFEHGQPLPFLPRVDVPFPAAEPGDAILGGFEVAAAERDETIRGHEFGQATAIRADHRLRIGVAARFPHHFHDVGQPALPVGRFGDRFGGGRHADAPGFVTPN